MPTMADLGKIASLLYEGNPSVGAKDHVENLKYNGKASELGLPEPEFVIWSNKEVQAEAAYYRAFYSTGTEGKYGYCASHCYGFIRDDAFPMGLCLVN